MSASGEVIMIYTTFPNLEEAKSVSTQIVMGKLAACANILPGMISIYEWEGRLEEENEIVVIFKTGKVKQESIISKICELHSYDTPAVLAIEANGGSREFIKWIADQTSVQ